MDHMESPPPGVPRHGRLLHIAQWLRQSRPLIKGSSVVSYVSQISSLVSIATGYDYVTSALYKRYKKRLEQQDKPSFAKQPANKALVAAVADGDTISPAVRVGVLMAFNGLLRAREYTSEYVNSITEGSTLLRNAVRFSPDYSSASVRIIHSKGDAKCRGPEMQFVARPTDCYCTVSNLRQYITWRDSTFPNSKQLPLLIHPDGRYVTPRDITAALRRHASAVGLDPERMTSHCLRYGGAHEMCDNGVPWEDIIIAGRWHSDDAKRLAMHYAKFSVKRATAIANAMHIQDRPSAQSFKPLFV